MVCQHFRFIAISCEWTRGENNASSSTNFYFFSTSHSNELLHSVFFFFFFHSNMTSIWRLNTHAILYLCFFTSFFFFCFSYAHIEMLSKWHQNVIVHFMLHLLCAFAFSMRSFPSRTQVDTVEKALIYIWIGYMNRMGRNGMELDVYR